MIMGDYPCCDGPLCLAVPDRPLPAFLPEICPHCGAKVWHKFSRWDPISWTDEEFRKLYDVNDETKQIVPKEENNDA